MASTTRCWARLCSLCLIWTCLWLIVPVSRAAEGIAVQRSALTIEGDTLSVSSRFQVTLPPVLLDAVQQGIPLTFQLTFELTRPRSTAYWLRVRHWFDPTAQLDFKLMYYRLTNRYRVSIGSLATSYASLQEAMMAIGGIAGWHVLSVEGWDQDARRDLRGRLQLSLDVSQLPRPFQLNALGSRDWSLSSSWIPLAPEGFD